MITPLMFHSFLSQCGLMNAAIFFTFRLLCAAEKWKELYTDPT
jgi:hypothetical protein